MSMLGLRLSNLGTSRTDIGKERPCGVEFMEVRFVMRETMRITFASDGVNSSQYGAQETQVMGAILYVYNCFFLFNFTRGPNESRALRTVWSRVR